MWAQRKEWVSLAGESSVGRGFTGKVTFAELGEVKKHLSKLPGRQNIPGKEAVSGRADRCAGTWRKIENSWRGLAWR